ncbi:MAG: IPT/TIG domain-containing protein [Acidobacteriaceae bacterium]
MRLEKLFGWVLLVAAGLAMTPLAVAGGPRWYAGSAYFDPAVMGQPVVWHNGQVVYYTDQGALSPIVSNAQANAMVATAAAVWSAVNTAAVSITSGGSLAEDVNGTNVTNGASGLVEPADIQSTDTSVPVAVVYDADGSVIDAIYGQGASDPKACPRNAVLTDVDNFSTTGNIVHAVMLVNGLCATTSTELENLQYEMVRGFGRVLGLDWSQANEEMFATNQVTTAGLAGWPIMHPVERLCNGGGGTCIPNGTTLRYDDISALNRAYPVTAANQSLYPGKTVTATATFSVHGTIAFKRGQGMQGVNVVLRPLTSSGPDIQYTVTAVSGASFEGDAGNPVTGYTDASGNALNRFGSNDQTLEGYYDLSGVPLPPGMTQSDYQLTFEPINSLYADEQSVGPYTPGQVTPSGTMPVITIPAVQAGMSVQEDVTIGDSADELQSGRDGTDAAPVVVNGSGQWTGRICCYGHSGWFKFYARANREFTVETEALDETGAATENKARPVIGLWNITDAVGTAPVTATAQPFNGDEVGLTTLSAVSTASNFVRIGIADQRGDGRPDYAYLARVLYADTVSPSRLPAAGGKITIVGMGFRPDSVVYVNGLAAQVTSVTATRIEAIAPPSNGATGTVLVEVEDPQTLGVAMIADGLGYEAQGGDALTILTAPSGTIPEAVPVNFTVRALGVDLSAAAGIPVTFAVTEGSAALGCGAATCTVVTDGNGVATMAVTPNSTALAQVTASLSNGAKVLAEFTGAAPSTLYAMTPNLYVAIGGSTTWSPQALMLASGQPLAGGQVLWQTTSPGITLATQATTTTNASGIATEQVTVSPQIGTNAGTVQACTVGTTTCVTFNVVPVHLETAAIVPVSGTTQSVTATQALTPVVLEATDAIGRPMAGATVTFHETMFAWTPACVGSEPCPSPPVLGQQTVDAVSASDGTVSLTPMANAGVPVRIVVQAMVGPNAAYDFELEQYPGN